MSTSEVWQPTFVGEGRVRYYSLARHALIEALRLADVRLGSRVLLPEYLCRDLLAPLHLLGATPCWYAVAPDMTPAASSSEWPLADVVLAVNYFGFAQDLEPFKDYAQRTGAVVIEDNAHGYLSRDANGLWLGCRTSLGVFSLRKTLRIPDGAALWAGPSYGVYDFPVQAEFDSIGVYPMQLVKARLRSLPLVGEFAYRLPTTAVRWLRKWRTGSDIPVPDHGAEQTLPALANPWAGLLSALSANDVLAEIARRRAAYASCAEVGEQVGAIPVFADLPVHCAPYAYVFRGDADAQDGMRLYAVRNGFDLISWPDLPTAIVGNAPEHYRNVFMVNLLW